MPKKAKSKIAAVIDIGSNELRLMIAQASPVDDTAERLPPCVIRYLEQLSYPLGLGRDTFQSGKISYEKVDKACEIIKNYQHIIKGYDVRNIKAVATSAVREASNIDYILDQIKLKTGLGVDVIDDLEEKNHIYKLLMHYAGETPQQSALMVYIGAGNIGVSVLENGRMPFLQNIKAGSLRMGELFEDLQQYTSDFYKLLEEYLAGFTKLLADEIPDGIQYFIASGHEIGLIAELLGIDTAEAFFDIPRDVLFSFYDEIKHKNNDQLAADFKIGGDYADVLLPAACIYQNLLRLTEAGHIMAARLLPCDAILFELLYPGAYEDLHKAYAKNTLLSAERLAQRYQIKPEHNEQVYDFSLTIFDKMKKIHGLGTREKLLLRAAAILHDIGKYVNNRDHNRHSYEIVRGSDIVGLSQLETEIVALICLFHSRQMPSLREARYAELALADRVRVSKLVAILRLADALDVSHIKKFSRISVHIDDSVLTVTVPTDADITLEEWAFNDKGRFFEEVFGIKAKLRAKRS